MSHSSTHPRNTHQAWFVVIAMLVLAAPPAHAQLAIRRSVIACGGGTAGVGAMGARGTTGQMDAGTLSMGPLTLYGGFWHGGSGGASSVEAPAGPAIALTRIDPAWPNPGRGSINLSFSLATPRTVRAAIYNLTGERVRTILDGPLPEGRFVELWDGKDQNGRPVGSGIYLLRVDVGSEEKLQKIVVVR